MQEETTVKKDEKILLFEEYPVSKAVAKLSIPTVMGTLVALLYNLADTYFVGLLNMPVQTAAVTLIAPLILAFNAINNLFGVGSSSMMSRALGRKDIETLKGSSAFGLYGAFVAAIIFSLLCSIFKVPLMTLLGTDSVTQAAASSYMFWTVTIGALPSIMNVVLSNQVRSEGSALAASIGVIGGCLLNIILDPVFILPWGLNLKAEGAALATCISNIVACLYYIVHLIRNRKHTNICISLKYIIPKKEVFLGVCGVGVPASIQNILNVIGTTILNVLATPFGPQAIAAIGICSKVSMVPMFISMGISQGVMPLVSYNFAANNKKRMKASVIFTGKILLVVLLTCSFLMLCFPNLIMSAFIQNAETITYGNIMLRGYGLGVTFLAIDFLAVAVFQATGYGKYALIFAILRKVVLEIPLLFILNAVWPLYGLAFAQTISELFLSILAIFMLKKIMQDDKS